MLDESHIAVLFLGGVIGWVIAEIYHLRTKRLQKAASDEANRLQKAASDEAKRLQKAASDEDKQRHDELVNNIEQLKAVIKNSMETGEPIKTTIVAGGGTIYSSGSLSVALQSTIMDGQPPLTLRDL